MSPLGFSNAMFFVTLAINVTLKLNYFEYSILRKYFEI